MADAKKSIFIFSSTETPEGAEELLEDEAKAVSQEMADEAEQKKQLTEMQKLSAEGNGGAQDVILDYEEAVEKPEVQKALTPDDAAAQLALYATERGAPSCVPGAQLQKARQTAQEPAQGVQQNGLGLQDLDQLSRVREGRLPILEARSGAWDELASQFALGKSMPTAPEELAKGGGEGSRGGHVIGHDAQGKPIYAKQGGAERKFEAGHTAIDPQGRHVKVVAVSGSGPEQQVTTRLGGSYGATQTHPASALRTVERTPDSGKVHPVFGAAPTAAEAAAYEEKRAKLIAEAAAQEAAKKSLTTEKSMTTGIDALSEYLQKAQSLPTGGEPKMDQGHGDGSPNGEDLATLPVPATGEQGEKGGGEIGAPSVPEQKLSEDDDKVADQLKDKAPPQSPPTTECSCGKSMDRTGNDPRAVAAALSNLRKGRTDVEVAPSDITPEPAAQPETVQKSQLFGRPDGLFVFSNESDLMVDRMMKGDGFYEGSAPSLGLQRTSIEDLASHALSKAKPQGVEFQKSEGEPAAPRKGPGLRPSRVDDVVLTTKKE